MRFVVPHTCTWKMWMTSQVCYLKLLISRSILSGPLDFEIKRVACKCHSLLKFIFKISPFISSPEPLGSLVSLQIGMLHRPLLSVRPPFSKIFSKTAGPIKAKFHVEPPWVWVTWPRWPPRPYMVQTFQKSSSPEPKGQWPCGFICSIGALGPHHSLFKWLP